MTLALREPLDVRILADDATGALDTAAAFADAAAIKVTWQIDAPPGPRAAVDLASGGPHAGLSIVSKSGGFGATALLTRVAAAAVA